MAPELAHVLPADAVTKKTANLAAMKARTKAAMVAKAEKAAAEKADTDAEAVSAAIKEKVATETAVAQIEMVKQVAADPKAAEQVVKDKVAAAADADRIAVDQLRSQAVAESLAADKVATAASSTAPTEVDDGTAAARQAAQEARAAVPAAADPTVAEKRKAALAAAARKRMELKREKEEAAVAAAAAAPTPVAGGFGKPAGIASAAVFGEPANVAATEVAVFGEPANVAATEAPEVGGDVAALMAAQAALLDGAPPCTTKPEMVEAGDAYITLTWRLHDESVSEVPGIEAALEFDVAYGVHLVGGRVANWRTLPCSATVDHSVSPAVWSGKLEGLEPGEGYVAKIRTRAAGGQSDFGDRTAVMRTTGEKKKRAETLGEVGGNVVGKLGAVAGKLKGNDDGGAAVEETVWDGGLSGGADDEFYADGFEAQLIEATANDDERPTPTVMDELTKTPHISSANVCGKIAEMLAARLATDLVRVKIKTLDLIMQILTSKHRTEDSKIRLHVQKAAQPMIEALQEYTCEPDLQFGKKPMQLVRGQAKRLFQLLADNLSRVAPEGDIKIGSRKKHESKLELKPGGKVSWEFTLEAKDIGFAVDFVVEREAGTAPETITVVRYTKLYAEHGSTAGSFAPEGFFERGTITFLWDNSYSKMTAKNMKFKLSFG
jgi:hypothetical protein